jgi:DNA-binding NtrC family response regulator
MILPDPDLQPSGGAKREVLVVDDDLSLLEALERALTQELEDCNIKAVGTFEEARRCLHEQTFDVLLTDVRLGAFNGLQLAVLARDVNPSTQIIVFSGFDDAVLRSEAEHLGATYLVKPVTANALTALIGKS